MLYQRLVEGYERVSQTTRRTEMAGTLVELLKETPPSLVHQVVYLTQGKLYPEFAPVEMGMAERLALKAVAWASGASEEEVRASLASTGDLGAAAERLLRDGAIGRLEKALTPALSQGERESISSPRPPVSPSPRLAVEEIYEKLDAIARSAGAGSVAAKIGLLADLLSRATPVEAKYILRTATGKLRLGLADMTLLDALALAYGGGKAARTEIERAYNLCSNLGAVATALATGGLKAMRDFHLQPGKPVRPMLAQRLPSGPEILKKLGGICRAEYEYDGERLQIHKLGDRVSLFSRRLEDATDQYPDAAQAVRGRGEGWGGNSGGRGRGHEPGHGRAAALPGADAPPPKVRHREDGGRVPGGAVRLRPALPGRERPHPPTLPRADPSPEGEPHHLFPDPADPVPKGGHRGGSGRLLPRGHRGGVRGIGVQVTRPRLPLRGGCQGLELDQVQARVCQRDDGYRGPGGGGSAVWPREAEGRLRGTAALPVRSQNRQLPYGDQVRHRLHRQRPRRAARAAGAVSDGPSTPTGGRSHAGRRLVHAGPGGGGAGGRDHPEPHPHLTGGC